MGYLSATARDSLPIGSSWLPNRGSGTTRTIPLPSSVSKAKDAETLGRLWQKKREWLRPRRVVSLPLRFFEQFAICSLLLAVVLGRMADSKQDILEMLKELAELTMLEEGDPQSFRVRAYESAAHAIEAQATDLGKMTAKDLQKIEGIGKSTAEKIRDLLEKGKVEKLEMLRAKHPASVVALLKIQGLGPKAVKRLRAELGVESIQDLQAAVNEQKLRGLKGFGQKSEEKLAASLARLAEQGSVGRTPISVALPLANRIVTRMLEVPGVKHASYCGSLRRFCETVGDVDVVVAGSEPGPVMDALVGMNVVDRVLVRGDSKTSIVTRRGTQVDVRVVAEHQLGAARLYFTGSKGHNIKLRQRALTREWTLNEYALSEIKGGKVIASETEEQIYEALGLRFIPPMLREDAGEIEAAEQGTLPQPIGPLFGDFHVHTTVSGDGRSSLEDVVAKAKALGYRVLALTDHAEGTLSGVSREAFLEQREKIRAMQATLGDSLKLLHGVELNIGPKGELDYDAEFRNGFDFCLASVHDHFELDKAAQTQRIVTAMQDPSVRMIGHLSARMIGGRPGIDVDLDAIFDAAEATHTALEVNGALPRLDMSVEALRRARARKVTFVLTSDAHHAEELERVRFAALNAERAWIEPSRIANAWPAERLIAWTQEKA
jgi:DNA polymerase (family 10)